MNGQLLLFHTRPCSSNQAHSTEQPQTSTMCFQYSVTHEYLCFLLAGTIGHVAHGKSTVVKAISGVQTVRFKNELERNITIKLGYANAKIFCAKNGKVPRPQSYKAYGSSKEDSPPCDAPGYEGAEMELLRHVSFVDCPGHDILMATMLNGAAVMDGALLLIAANESCPQPQTSEHLAAVEIMRLKHIIILQNKIDLISESVAANQHEAIASFIQGTIAEGAPVVPISAQLKYNVDAVCEYIVKKIPVPVRSVSQSHHSCWHSRLSVAMLLKSMPYITHSAKLLTKGRALLAAEAECIHILPCLLG